MDLLLEAQEDYDGRVMASLLEDFREIFLQPCFSLVRIRPDAAFVGPRSVHPAMGTAGGLLSALAHRAGRRKVNTMDATREGLCNLGERSSRVLVGPTGHGPREAAAKKAMRILSSGGHASRHQRYIPTAKGT